MPAALMQNAYGKSRVRLCRVFRNADRHELREWNVAIQLEGDFIPSYTVGDNSLLVATDTMKNTVYILAKKHAVMEAENFGTILASHFLDQFAHVSKAIIHLEENLWNRMEVKGVEHPHAFSGGGSETRVTKIVADRKGFHIEAGLDGLLVLKTTDSAFAGYLKDAYTTLLETQDRIFATSLSATWNYGETRGDWDLWHRETRQALLSTFAQHKSLGVQQTLYAMGVAALDACSAIQEITLKMPNKHRLLFPLTPFGLENNNEVFVATDEPHGLISGTIRRE